MDKLLAERRMDVKQIEGQKEMQIGPAGRTGITEMEARAIEWRLEGFIRGVIGIDNDYDTKFGLLLRMGSTISDMRYVFGLISEEQYIRMRQQVDDASEKLRREEAGKEV